MDRTPGMSLRVVAARRLLLLMLAALTLVGCDVFPGFDSLPAAKGPEVTHIVVDKSDRNLRLHHHDRVLNSYTIDLGTNPQGHKARQGDGRTPEGWYRIDRKNPQSRFHLSLGISYPNAHDTARARARGVSPGGDIFIHGLPNDGRAVGPDWTEGCIAVTNRQIETIYRKVAVGTPILIRP